MYQNYNEPNSNDYNSKKEIYPSDNYYGSKHRDQKNNRINYNNNDFDNEFEKTKNKIKVIIYKNGFILNNEPFRDKSIPENRKFMEEVDKGLIPQEIMRKGIKDLGILLENRKNEVYTKKTMNPITNTLKAYISDNQNDINNLQQNLNIKPDLNDINYLQDDLNNINLNQGIDSNIKINPPIILNPGENIPYNLNFQDPYLLNQHQNQNQKQNKQKHHQHQQNYNKYNNQTQQKRQKIDQNNMCHTPIGDRNDRKNVFDEKNLNEKDGNFEKKKRESSSTPKKKEEKKIKTFASLIREEKEKEEEEKKQKKAQQTQKATNQTQNKEGKKEEEKKFQAFTGAGQLIGNINTQGLHVHKNVKNVVDQYSPICIFNVRLFNGEIVKCEFNYTQTLRDIYYYIREISGSNNFHLLDGFPPKPLREYNKLIGELHLDNTTLTQKIKEN